MEWNKIEWLDTNSQQSKLCFAKLCFANLTLSFSLCFFPIFNLIIFFPSRNNNLDHFFYNYYEDG